MNEKIFELGSRRRVVMEVWLSSGQTFTPTECQWTLTPAGCPGPEATGSCDAEEKDGKWLLTALVEPKKKTTYSLQYSFTMGDEVVKRSERLRVV